jgi:hypothetical protein
MWRENAEYDTDDCIFSGPDWLVSFDSDDDDAVCTGNIWMFVACYQPLFVSVLYADTISSTLMLFPVRISPDILWCDVVLLCTQFTVTRRVLSWFSANFFGRCLNNVSKTKFLAILVSIISYQYTTLRIGKGIDNPLLLLTRQTYTSRTTTASSNRAWCWVGNDRVRVPPQESASSLSVCKHRRPESI